MDEIYKEWIKFPTGKIGKGEWCGHCARYNCRRITCTVIGVKDNMVMMVLRAQDPQKGFWSFPGGYLFWDESAEECATREFREETGNKVVNLRLLGVYSNPKRDLDGRQNVDVCFYGEVNECGGSHDSEVEQVKWFRFDKLPDNIAFDHRQMMEDYIALQSELR